MNKTTPFLIGSLCGLPFISHGQERPNVVLILADDLGNADVGYHNQDADIQTPNIDRLASEGVHFTSGYVTAPVSGPSRAGMLSGCYQHSFGFEDNPGPFRTSEDVIPGIPTHIKNIGEYFKAGGYATACIGKWHVGGEESDLLLPANRGFDEFFGFLGGALGYFQEGNPEEAVLRNNTPIDTEKNYMTDAFGREAVSFINRHQDEPFFLYLPFNAVHGPLQVPDSLKKLYSHVQPAQRQILCAMQHSMDQNIGMVMKALEDLDLENNTLVIFLSDNGGALNDNFSYNLPYRGEKGTLFEGGIRLPFLMKWPGHITAGSTFDKPISSLDIIPTALTAAQIDFDATKLHGTNLLPYIQGEDDSFPHESLCWRLNNNWAVRDTQWKLLNVGGSARPMLFNIAEDPSETTDLYESRPDIVAAMKDKYNQWEAQMLPPQWGWQPSVGNYVKHVSENFENVVKLKFKELSKGTPSIVENPYKEGINTSNHVLKIVVPKDAPNFSGAWATISRFNKKYRYAHVKIWKDNTNPVRFKVEGDNNASAVAANMNPYTTPGEWQELVFDLDFYQAVNRINIQPDFTANRESDATIYIDDIYMSDSPDAVTTRIDDVEAGAEPPINVSVQGNRLTYEINLSETTDLHVSLYDMQGKLIQQAVHPQLSAGIHSFNLFSQEKGILIFTANIANQRSFVRKVSLG